MKTRWTVLLGLPALLAGCASLSSHVVSAEEGTLEAQALWPLPAGGTDLLGAGAFGAFPIYSGGAVKVEAVPVGGRTFTQAWRVTDLVKLEQPYLSQLSASSVAAVKAGDALVVQFWARSVGGPAQTEFVFESNDKYEKSATVGVQLSPQWKLYSASSRSKLDYEAGNGGARFRLGYDQQSFELGGVVLKNSGPGLPLSSLPTAGFTYAGCSASAPWRAAISARTEQLRKSDVTVMVVDKSGNPFPARPSGWRCSAMPSRSAARLPSSACSRTVPTARSTGPSFPRCSTEWC